jgi:pimeloyl-ACP methyl ester carboxylesterase
MRRLAAFRALSVCLAILAATAAPALAAEGGSTPSNSTPSTTNIVVGFVGGFVSHDNPHHGPVQLAERIRPQLPPGAYVRVFENRHRKSAYSAILRLLDADRDGLLSPAEKSRAHIVLFGQSWGASAAVLLARDLRQAGVPVLLTVQVDSVAKIWQNDSIIPDNVAEAINFYQPHGLVHGRRRIEAADPSRTAILGNYLVDYRKNPVACPQASWFDRLFTPSHMESECDPRLWSQIENLVRERLLTRDISAQAFSDPAETPSSQR